MEKVFNGNSCSVVYHKDKKRLTFTFVGYVNIDEAKLMYISILSFMKENPVVSFLNDLREIKGTFTNLNSWIIENMQPALGLGLKYDAMVLNSDIFSVFAANDFAKKVTKLELNLFKSMEEAERWLASRES